jgi:hypothetical protein
MEYNHTNVRRIGPDKYGDDSLEPATPAQMERLLARIQPIVKRNRVRARNRRVLKASGLICSLSFFIWSANIFDSHPGTIQPATEFAANLSVMPARTEQTVSEAIVPESVGHVLTQAKDGQEEGHEAASIPEVSRAIQVPVAAEIISEPPGMVSAADENNGEDYTTTQAGSTDAIRVTGMEGGAASKGRAWYTSGAESNSVYAPDTDLNIERATGAPLKLPD